MRRVFVAGLLLAFMACARGADVHLLAKDSLPDDLYGGSRRPLVSPRPVRTVVYFVRVNQRGIPVSLTPVTREDVTPLRAAEFAMRQLLNPQPLSREEFDSGIRTSIPNDTELLGITVSRGLADVNLSAQFESAGPESLLVLRAAQIVWTLADLPDIESVRFRVHGVPQPVVDQFGVAHDKVGPARYSRFAPSDQQEPSVSEGPLLPEEGTPTPQPGG